MSATTALGLEGTLLFHLNLNRGSIEVAQRRRVLAEGYAPLLELVERRPALRITLAASGHSLERIEHLDPNWIVRLRSLMDEGRVHFVGTGDTHLIGPLVPAAVNRWNQELGRETYLRLLGHAPRVARVNEMAWSQGLVDAYLDAGYEALITEWNDARRFHPEWSEDCQYRPVWTASPTGRRIRVLFADALLSRVLARATRAEAAPEAFLDTVQQHFAPGARHVFLHAQDAEELVADSAFEGPASLAPLARCGEWERLAALCDALLERGVELTSPEALLDDERYGNAPLVELAAAAHPVPVRRRRQNGIAHWALSGWDSPGLNAVCFGRARELERRGGTARDWRLLCRVWGADLRTNLSAQRWERLARSLPAAPSPSLTRTAFSEAPLRARLIERVGSRLALATEGLQVTLNLNRGMALDSIAFSHAGPDPLLGLLAIGEGTRRPERFFSGHTIFEFADHGRVTDLEPVEPQVEERTHYLRVHGRVQTPLGCLPKEVRLYGQRLEIRYGFSALGERPRALLRTGILTLQEGALGRTLWVTCANGGARERMPLVLDADTRPEAPIRALFGATDGWISIDDGKRGFEVTWPHEEAAALPRVLCTREGSRRILRIEFCLAEVDESFRPGAPLRDFRISIRPYRNRR